MKRPFPIVLMAGLIVTATGALLLPLADCPICSSAVEYPDFPFALGCPRCKDRGRLSWLGRWRSRPLDPDLQVLLNCYRHPSWEVQERFYPTMRRLAARSDRTLASMIYQVGYAVFVDDDGEPRVAAVLEYSYSQDAVTQRIELVVFDLDGRIVDFVEVRGAAGPAAIQADWSEPPRSAWALELRSEGAEGFRLRRGSESTAVKGPRLGLRVRNGRFESLP
jgi:hypothetical protein